MLILLHNSNAHASWPHPRFHPPTQYGRGRNVWPNLSGRNLGKSFLFKTSSESEQSRSAASPMHLGPLAPAPYQPHALRRYITYQLRREEKDKETMFLLIAWKVNMIYSKWRDWEKFKNKKKKVFLWTRRDNIPSLPSIYKITGADVMSKENWKPMQNEYLYTYR